MQESPLFYQTVDCTGTAEFRDRGSKFIGYVFPMADVAAFKEQMALLKKEHPKATHHCFAYRLDLDGNNFRVSDDGEPSGSAGRPILGQIDSRQITNVLVVVVRYFGGTLLGVPGLINAYKSTAAMALQVTPVVRKPVEMPYSLQFDYTLLNEIMVVVKQTDCRVISQDLQLFCRMKIAIPRHRLEEVLFRFNQLHTLELVAG